MVFSRDGNMLATAGNDGLVKLWDSQTGIELSTISAHADAVSSLACSPDGNTFATSGEDGAIKLWNWHTAKLVRTFSARQSIVGSLVFSSDGKWLAAAHSDGVARVCNTSTASIQQTFTHKTANSSGLRPDEMITSFAFSPDAKLIVTAARDGTIRFWEFIHDD